jgi:hypothetical protein
MGEERERGEEEAEEEDEGEDGEGGAEIGETFGGALVVWS